MISSSLTDTIARARPLLGTLVRMRICGLAPAVAQTALESAFAEVARIHAAMSFQSGMSDVARLNRAAHLGAVRIDKRTYAVLQRAVEISTRSNGVFDPTVAPKLVQRDLLHRQLDASDPDPDADFRDILFLPEQKIRFARPLWIDLSGIAKGYAVDRAVARLAAFGASQICVNAGGDLRVMGPRAERVALAVPQEGCVPVIEMKDGALASSANDTGVHFHGLHRAPVLPGRFASIAAPSCLEADALTKIVLADPDTAQPLLAQYKARAFVFDDGGSVSTLGLAA
jgi:FAD:protein FMN transferase